MGRALYGPGGFFTGEHGGPADHFRTSVHASPLFAGALLRVITQVDQALGQPEKLQVVDVGAGRGELLAALHALAQGNKRFQFTGVEVASRPEGLPADIAWRHDMPMDLIGVLLATGWLDNVPLDVAEVDEQGRIRRVLVDPATGLESLGGEIDAADRFWIARWWPWAGLGDRIEVGWPRDLAWANAVSSVRRGAALTVDYGHVRGSRPPLGTLTGFRGGRQLPPVPDGMSDLTAHVALDAVAGAAGVPYRMISQRQALKALGIDGARPPLDLARTDPAAYLRALATSSSAAELIDPDGLGGHWWLLHEVGIELHGTI
ncbi:SAM-dependent methyltransferase [Actinoplanes sp. TFC3]|uniref:SAM-dependent methyltransferase n=1 Tax=Actinoplanes sp. TFC3 TaxID=1710355 RepID=UPI0008340FA3|nr:SAM-dependent methyltransferase [Actinoplanes sp. TFC3]